ncbi:MAG: ISAzo13 family transposase, partial [Nitrospirae bacterium]|nr:ISAzo13 family transposase [Candidatus Troglogloeales bacterium]
CRLDRRKYPVGREITKAELESINIIRQAFHGEWNYTIRPHQSAKL